jgi:hypothetical protein
MNSATALVTSHNAAGEPVGVNFTDHELCHCTDDVHATLQVQFPLD